MAHRFAAISASQNCTRPRVRATQIGLQHRRRPTLLRKVDAYSAYYQRNQHEQAIGCLRWPYTSPLCFRSDSPGSSCETGPDINIVTGGWLRGHGCRFRHPTPMGTPVPAGIGLRQLHVVQGCIDTPNSFLAFAGRVQRVPLKILHHIANCPISCACWANACKPRVTSTGE